MHKLIYSCMYLELAPCVSVVFIDTVICYSILAIKFIQGQRSPTTCTVKLACNLQLMIEMSLILIFILIQARPLHYMYRTESIVGNPQMGVYPAVSFQYM